MTTHTPHTQSKRVGGANYPEFDLAQLQLALNALRELGFDVAAGTLYGARKPSVVIVIDGVSLVDGRLVPDVTN